MADKYKFKIESVCAGGEHITIKHLRNGEEYKTATYSREDIATGKLLSWVDAAPLLIARALKSSGAKSDDEYISTIEGLEIIL